jgi:glycerol-3-phosphate dehydrogenase
MDDAKLTLECIYDGLVSTHSYACNHVSLQGALKTDSGYQLHLKDELTKEERVISCRQLIFTTGPFTDILLKKLNLFPWKPKLALSRGSHLWVANEMLQAKGPMVLTPNDGRVIFVIPQRDKTLVGTTEVPGTADYNQSPSQEEVTYLLNNLKDFFPKADISEKYITGRFAGVRPLVMDNPDANLGKVARNHRVYQPQENVFILLGGKYTTFRVMARDVVEPLMHKLKLPYRSELSLRPLRRKSHITPWQDFELNQDLLTKVMEDEFPKTVEDLMYRRIGQTFAQDKDLEAQVSKLLEESPWSLKP